MFGNKELQETRDQLGRTIDFWADAIIKMDPVARKLTISQYEIYISGLELAVSDYERTQD